ncbi:MAG: hypothetical protein JSW00_00560 [Thermoplasmata archaeon]|nr:MAG: hypothetical protein JSW00_00560 [Thermoplasmata archaeon]
MEIKLDTKRSPIFRVIYPSAVKVSTFEKGRIRFLFESLATSVPREKGKPPIEMLSECEIVITSEFFVNQMLNDLIHVAEKYYGYKPPLEDIERWASGNLKPEIVSEIVWKNVLHRIDPDDESLNLDTNQF